MKQFLIHLWTSFCSASHPDTVTPQFPQCQSFLLFKPFTVFLIHLLQSFNLAPARPFISHSLTVSLPLSRSGSTWYSLACLSSRRLDGTNLLQQPHVLVRMLHSTKPEQVANVFLDLSLQLILILTDLSCFILSGHILSFSVLGWQEQTYRDDCGILPHHDQPGEFFSFLLSHLTVSTSCFYLILCAVRSHSVWRMSFPSIKSEPDDWQVQSQRTDSPGVSGDGISHRENVSSKEVWFFLWWGGSFLTLAAHLCCCPCRMTVTCAHVHRAWFQHFRFKINNDQHWLSQHGAVEAGVAVTGGWGRAILMNYVI